MNRPDLISERAFALLLEQRRIPYVREDDLETAVSILDGKRPDFCLPVGPPHVLAEVT